MRVLLGLVEGPMPPCIVCYLSGFYTRKDLSLRFVCLLYSHLLVFSMSNPASRIALFFSTASVCIEIICKISLIPDDGVAALWCILRSFSGSNSKYGWYRR